VDLLTKKLASIEYEDGNPFKPMVHIEDLVFEGLCAPWQDALVVKLLGKHIAYPFLKGKLTRMWKLRPGFDMLNIGNGYFHAQV